MTDEPGSYNDALGHMSMSEDKYPDRFQATEIPQDHPDHPDNLGRVITDEMMLMRLRKFIGTRTVVFNAKIEVVDGHPIISPIYPDEAVFIDDVEFPLEPTR